MQESTSPTRHYCDHVDCGKSFRRAEHLTRHKLNHTNDTIQCPQCDRLFYRKDLLHRHINLKHGRLPRTSASVVGQDQGHSDDARSAGLHAESPVNSSSIDLDVTSVDSHANLHLLDRFFPFSTPAIDVGHAWTDAWSSPRHPVLPLSVSQPSTVHTIPDDSASQLGSFHQPWMGGDSSYELFVSQEVCDFLMSQATAPGILSSQDINSLLNVSCRFIAQSLPIFHMPSFNFDLLKRELCASLFCVGLLISRNTSLHEMGCSLLSKIRATLLQYVQERPVYLDDLNILQAMLIVEYSGLYLADRAAMELSDMFHGTLICIFRRLGLGEISNKSTHAVSETVDESRWQSPVHYESAKRLAYFIFAIDVEQTLLFGHERRMFSFHEIRLELPTDDEVWLAQGPAERTLCMTKFHVLCRNLLPGAFEGTYSPLRLPQISYLVILLGLSSVAMDLLRRQKDPFPDSQQELPYLGSAMHVIHDRLIAGPNGQVAIHGRVIYHITAIALCTPLDDLERAANDGFSRSGRTPRYRARAAIIRLSAKKVAQEPARHAVQLLRLFLLHPNETSEPYSTEYLSASHTIPSAYPSPYEPSALYIGTLTLWAYIIGRMSEAGEHEVHPEYGTPLADDDRRSPATVTSSSGSQHTLASYLQNIEDAIAKEDVVTCKRYWGMITQPVMVRLAQRQNNNAKEYSQVVGSLSDDLGF